MIFRFFKKVFFFFEIWKYEMLKNLKIDFSKSKIFNIFFFKIEILSRYFFFKIDFFIVGKCWSNLFNVFFLSPVLEARTAMHIFLNMLLYVVRNITKKTCSDVFFLYAKCTTNRLWACRAKNSSCHFVRSNFFSAFTDFSENQKNARAF